ncbi:MAG: nitrous oxide reductase accessory protein NosL [Campylobacterota bacterium]|nr:nitrous oxide reductase accessory protein NosL [Campylobacterota bacterium]
MTKILLLSLFLTGLLFANELSLAKVVKLSNKGEKIVKTLCKEKVLPSSQGTIDELIKKIKVSKACPPLSNSKLKAVAFYVSNGSMKLVGKHIEVPTKAKCPVCGMFVHKYPKWAAYIKHDGKSYYFDGVKDMMKYYIFDGDFPYKRSNISKITVSDYYTLEEIEAKEAFYVLDSDVYGPMGRELIPFKSQKSAEAFMADHNGKALVKFDEITDKMVMALDGIEQP